MSNTIWVKVIGFNAAERHTINTLFRVSGPEDTSYSLWTPDCAVVPHVALVDMDCHEAEVELASPTFNPNVKLIGVGETVHPEAWSTFARPVDWNDLINTLNTLFVPTSDDYTDTKPGEFGGRTVPPGVRVSLIVGLGPEERLYLRARLALAGLTDVDETDSAAATGDYINQRHYDVVFVSLDIAQVDAWGLVQTLQGLLSPPQAIVVMTANPSWAAMEKAESLGCTGLLEIPFNPPQVIGLLQKV